jgi:V8-like Glu-specific endopeptidase
MKKLTAFLGIALATLAPISAQDVVYPAPVGADLTKTYPYSMAGQMIFTSGDSDYQGSGVVVFKRSVLTAAHNLWDADGGWSTNVEFNRARHEDSVATKRFATRLYVFGGYQRTALSYGADSDYSFARDMGGMRFASQLAAGSYAGWKADLNLLTGTAYNICLGYGADYHSGDELLFTEPETSWARVYKAYYDNTSLTFEGGMSGGPVFAELPNGEWRVTGIIVAGSDEPPAGGIHAITTDGAKFLSTYLRY